MSENYLDLIKVKKTEIEDEVWFKNFAILFNKNRLTEFFPSTKMTLEEKINATVRLFSYISVVLTIVSGNSNYIYLMICVMLLSYFAYINYNPNNIEKYSNSKKNYVKPTIDNPFMNIQLDDYVKNPNRDSLQTINNYQNKLLNQEINDKFNYNLYRDVGDIFDKNNSQRQFYTTPITTIPNDQNSFAKWLYHTDKTCKENNGSQCLSNQYTNLKQSSLFR